MNVEDYSLIANSHYKDACDAIREKDGIEGAITAPELAPRIRKIKTNDIELDHITILNPPKKTKYLPGERFDPAGMVIEATYNNGAKLTATGYTWTPNGDLDEGTSVVTILYTETGKTVSVTQTITVEREVIYVPSQSGSLTYNGSAQSPVWSNYDSSKMVLSGATKRTDAGSYTAIFTPNMQYKWPDGGTDGREVIWKIGQASESVFVDLPSVSINAAEKSKTVKVTRLGTGAISATSSNATIKVSVDQSSGNITITPTKFDSISSTISIKVAADKNHTSASTSISVTVVGLVQIPYPVQSGSLTYNGGSQSPKWNNYDPDKMELGGTTSGQNAGSYQATFTPKVLYKWPDGTQEVKTITWSIQRASGKVTLSPSSVTLDPDHKSVTVEISRLGDGAISVSGGGGIVSTSLSGTTLTITSIGDQSGDTSVTVNVAQSTNYLAASAVVSVKAKFIPTLQDASWAEIREASDNGMASTYWKVGDTKTITINGQVGNTNFSNLKIDVVIIGFDHNASLEGKNRIHFLIGKSGGKLVGLYDNKYSPDHGWAAGGAGDMVMNTSNTNAGGWNASYMRKTILGGDRNPNSPLSNSLLAALPPDLRAVMKPVTKYTDNTGQKRDTSGAVTATTDYLFLLAEHEVHGGNRTYANQYEKNSQAQYAYFATGNAKVANKYNATGTAVYWWLRSAHYTGYINFCIVDTSGSPDYYNAYYSLAVLAGFAV